MSKLRVGLKRLCSRLIPDTRLLHYSAHLASLRKWESVHCRDVPESASRFEMYDRLSSSILSKEDFDYLEFGVYKGDSIREWARLNKNPDCRFTGFDTFTGLPESWDSIVYKLPAGHFSTGGRIPEIADSRVDFVAGLFQDTLPGFLADRAIGRRRLIVHNDSDLYSSTLYVLATLGGALRNGTLVVFDEFSSPLHEFRAFIDFTLSWGWKYKVVGKTKNLEQVAIELLS